MKKTDIIKNFTHPIERIEEVTFPNGDILYALGKSDKETLILTCPCPDGYTKEQRLFSDKSGGIYEVAVAKERGIPKFIFGIKHRAGNEPPSNFGLIEV